jgi:putative spermidine/putrescine transport system ATP-binding protein
VSDVSLDVRGGEFVTLLGPSGSGKTTILMMLAGFEQPTEGDIFIGDRCITAVPPHRRNLSMVFQGYALFPHRTVERNISFPLEMRKYPRAEIAIRVRKTLEITRLSGLESRLPHQLSGGQQQRVALARAIVFEPAVLLMDEPLGALDKNLRGEMQVEIKTIQNRLGNTVLYVTHDQQEALSMSDRIAVVNQGHIEQLDRPEDIYLRPRTRFVAGFLGESNFIEGTTVASDPMSYLQFRAADGTLVGGWALQAPSAGTTGALTIRPERIRLVPTAVERRHVCQLPGKIKDVIFMGDARKFIVSTTVGHLEVKVQNDATAARLGAGDTVTMTWEPSDALFLAQ